MSTCYEVHFVGLTGDKLFEIEEATDEDGPSEYVEALLRHLAKWQRELAAWQATADMSKKWNQRRLERETAAYNQALNRVREAWLQWSFRHTGTASWLPESFDLPPAKETDQ